MKNVSLTDFFRALAGSPEAQFEMIACTVYGAVLPVFTDNQKTPFLRLQEDAKTYGTNDKARDAVKEFLGVAKVNNAVKQFNRTYMAIAHVLDHLGIPEALKDLPQGKANRAAREAIADPFASDYADQFASEFVVMMNTPDKTEAERAATAEENKAKREAKKAESEAKAKAEKEAFAESIRSEASQSLDAAVVAEATIDAIKAGLLSPSMLQALRVALSIADTEEAIKKASGDVLDVDCREVSEVVAIAA